MKVHVSVDLPKQFGDTLENWLRLLELAKRESIPLHAYLVWGGSSNPERVTFSWYEER